MKKQVSQETMDAMKELLDCYKNKTNLSSCPLCKIHILGWNKCSSKCPWILFGYKSYYGNSFACEEWASANDLSAVCDIRSEPETYNVQRKRRIGMLVQWIRNSEVV